jgi:hypothetical protein
MPGPTYEFEGRPIPIGPNGVLDLAGLDHETLLRLKAQLDRERSSILGQISEARSGEREGGTFDKDWYARARTTHRLKGTQLEQVMLALRAIRQASGDKSFPRLFVDAAREVLSPDDYARVLARVRQKREERVARESQG